MNKYFIIQYQIEPIGEKNASRYFSVDESLFCHRNIKAILILGAVDNIRKDFRLEGP